MLSPTTGSKKGQAMLETVLLIPFVVVMIFFIYQAYITVNRVQVVQRSLKNIVIGSLMNRSEVTTEVKSTKNPAGKTPADGQYFFVYNQFGDDSGTPGMNIGLDKSTASILLTFMTRGDRSGLEARLTDGLSMGQAMGICLGGRSVMNEQVDTKVLEMQDGDTCSKK